MPQLRVGIVGLGFATTLMLPYLSTHREIRVAAAADPRPEAREAFHRQFGGPTYATAQSLYSSNAIDAVYVASPNRFHAEHVISAITAGKHVIVEKPMAISEQECRAIEGAVTRHGVHVVCGHSHVFDAPIVAMSEIVRSGSLGAPTMIVSSNYTDIMYRPRADWELDTSQGGGVVFMQAPHQIDIARGIAGLDPSSVRARTTASDPERPTEGGYLAFLELAGDVPVSLVYSGYGYFDSRTLTFGRGERGERTDPNAHAATWSRYLARTSSDTGGDGDAAEREARRYGSAGAPGNARHREPAAQPFFGLTIVSCEHGDIRQTPDGVAVITRTGEEHISVSGREPGGAAVITELCAAVFRDEEPLHDARWASTTVRTCIGMLESSAQGREVELGRDSDDRRQRVPIT